MLGVLLIESDTVAAVATYENILANLTQQTETLEPWRNQYHCYSCGILISYGEEEETTIPNQIGNFVSNQPIGILNLGRLRYISL